MTESKPSLSTLKDSLSHLPDATYEDFLDLKKIWEPRIPDSELGSDAGTAPG